MATRPTGTVAVNETDLHYGDTVTFTVDVSEPVPTFVRVTCYQDEQAVGIGFTNTQRATHYVTDTTGMYSPVWTSGAAECKAELLQYLKGTRTRTLATTTFSVAA